jgi:glycosyltransferase involved in cell wall biosynthesis
LTYSPFALWREHKALLQAEETWRGNLVCCLPYLSTGGAEQVHADILATVMDQHPLIVMCGFSTDRAFAGTYAERGTLLELPHLINHPLTARSTNARLARLIDAQDKPVLFSSLTRTFFDLLPLIRASVPAYYLQHAFLYQPAGNLQHKTWLRHFHRINGYIFISKRSKQEFEHFLHANNIPRSLFGKLTFIGNAVRTFGEVRMHDRTGLLFVGRRSPEKRLELFLALCAELEKTHPGRFRSTVVGSDAVSGHGHVTFRGKVTDPLVMATIYAEHDVLALTSDREGFPMVIMEAMAQGLVVLSTPVGDVPERLAPAYSVITTDPHEPTVLREMSAALIALDQDRARLQSMRSAAIEEARSAFDPQLFRTRYRELLIK